MAKREYNFTEIEAKWQGFWEGCGLFRIDENSTKEKLLFGYVSIPFRHPTCGAW